MPKQNYTPMIRARKRLTQLKQNKKAEDIFSDALTETFERPDAHIGKKVEETE
mgnify:CR=1 FL=1|tara:strand:+ start:582 stop:740 length:159 start_codon:yes stop_codon:yes gene_type:complete